jgi:HEAT repeat protein
VLAKTIVEFLASRRGRLYSPRANRILLMRAYQMHRLAAVKMGCRALGLLALAVAMVIPILCSRVLAQAPGPELFAKEPRTPLELWDAIDYLLRTKQPKKALPYIDKFVKSNPDDATLIAIRDRYGPGSILQLSDDAETRRFAQPLAEAMVAAARKYATRPERIARFISELTRTSEEQDYAVRHLREAGPDAIPFLVEALGRPNLSDHDRQLIVQNMGRLDRSVIPALSAVLDSPDPTLVADAARALGMIGDKEAVPFLTFPAASAESSPVVRSASQEAVSRLTGQSFFARPRTPTQVLTDAAWRYHRHQVEFPDDVVSVWAWDNDRKTPVAQQVPRTEAEAILGLRLAKQALQLDPSNREARVAQISLTLDKAIERVGFTSFPGSDPASFGKAKAGGPLILSEVLKTAITDGKPDLAAAAATALGQVTDRAALATGGRSHPLVEALYAPQRRVQFAAARALVTLSPTEPFPGSSQIVPVLARFVTNQELSRAVVIDGNPNRGSQLAGLLIKLGYDAELELSGVKGFLAAAESADVELILISFDLFKSGWSLNDTLANLQADSRTAGIPIFIYGPLNVQYMRPNLDHDYRGIKFVVQPVDPSLLQQQLKSLIRPLTDAERKSYARESAVLLARIATERKGPLAADLTAAEPAMAVALAETETAPAIATALAEVPDADAQRSLFDVVIDPSRAPALRKQAAAHLVRSIQRFGPLVTADQEARLLPAIREETDAEDRANLMAIVQALRPSRSVSSNKPPVLSVPAESPEPGQTSPPPFPAPR